MCALIGASHSVHVAAPISNVFIWFDSINFGPKILYLGYHIHLTLLS